jgi:hypothetical protein
MRRRGGARRASPASSGRTPRVRRVPRADEVAKRERVPAQPVVGSDGLCVVHDLRNAGELLDAQHAEREKQPSCDAALLAAKAVVEQRDRDEAEVGLRLAATGGKPKDIDRIELRPEAGVVAALASGERSELGHDEHQLKESPLRPLPLGPRERFIG